MAKRTVDQLKQDVEDGSKVCNKCGDRKPFREYSKASSSVGDGYSYTCHECKNKTRRKRVEPNHTRSSEQVSYDIAHGSKVCSRCGDRRIFKHFPNAKRGADGHDCICYKCKPKRDKKYSLASRYGLSAIEYEQLVVEHQGVCGICNKPEINGKSLAIDHDHETGKVRGLLCRSCNTGLGNLGDSVESLETALKYLRRSYEDATYGN